MKIGILTQPLYNNYGGILQNYALQTVLKNMGHEVYTIDRRSPPMSPFRKAASIAKRILLRMVSQKTRIRVWPTAHESAIVSQHTQHFINEHIQRTRIVTSTAELKQLHREYRFDAYIVGSDQVWRPKYSPCLPNYFLDFIENDKSVKKIAYAASFGVDDWEFSDAQTASCARLAQQFDAVSVREDSAVRLCKEYLAIEAVHVLDPTMLLDKKKYIELVENHNTQKSKGNLFVYILDHTEDKEKIINEIADSQQLIPFEVMPQSYFNESKKATSINNYIFPPVTEWLRAFMDAEFIVTDSFHGAVFSIVFGKPFVVFANYGRGIGRITSLLRMFGLESSLILFNDVGYNNITKSDSVFKNYKKKQIGELLTKSLLFFNILNN